MMLRARAWASTPLTVALACACTGIWAAAQLHDGGEFGPATAWAVTDASALWTGSIGSLWTSSLVHYQLLHLVFNLYWLVRLGRPLEQNLGALRLLAFSAAASFVASAAQLGWSGHTGVGFSGVIYAWAGFLWIASPRHADFGAVMTKQI